MKPAENDAATVALCDFAERLADALDMARFFGRTESSSDQWRDLLRVAWLAELIHEDEYCPPPDYDIEEEVAVAYRPLISEARLRMCKEGFGLRV